MPGRNDPCPCGSGRKYKKCCLEGDNALRRLVAEADRFDEDFYDAIDLVHALAARHHGLDLLDDWSESFQGGDPVFEEELFKAFTACHVPFQKVSSLAAWVLNHGKLEEIERRVLVETLSAPFSLWAVDEMKAGTAKLRDLLSGTQREVVLASRFGDCQKGQVFYGKVVDRHTKCLFLAPSPVRLSEDVTTIVVRSIKGKQTVMSHSELMDPNVQSALYRTWCTTFRRLLDEGEPEPPNRPEYHRLIYNFDSRKQSWVSKALSESPAFVQREPNLFTYPGKGEPEAVLRLSSSYLLVDATRVLRIEILERVIDGVLGELVRLQERQSVDPLEHMLKHGIHSTPLPGLPAMADALSPAELRMAERALEQLRAMVGTDPDFADYDDDGPLEDLFRDYLDDRCRVVSKAVLKRDHTAIERLHQWLGHGATVGDLREYLSAYLHLLHSDRFGEGEKTLESMRPLVEWLHHDHYLDPEEFDEVVESLLGPVKKRQAVTYTFVLTLVGSQPEVWRKVQIPGRYRLDQVHKMMQQLFGWEDYHLHEFEFGHRVYTDIQTHDLDYDRGERDERLPLFQALGLSGSFLYKYDFGDSWEIEAKLLKTEPGDSDAPECLAGAMAGPPEDCGGIGGFEALKAILANPKDPEYEAMKTWAPPSYDAKAFSAEKMTAKLAKRFGRKKAAPKGPVAGTLAGYRLAKVKVLEALVAALTESSPQTLEQVQARLEELNYPLRAGQESLRRSIAASSVVRKRMDGAYELVDGPALKRVLADLDFFHKEARQKPAPPVEVEPITGPFSLAELDSARAYGHFPPQMSTRRQLLLLLEANGGKLTVDQCVLELGRVYGRPTWLNAHDLLTTLKGTSAVEIDRQNLKLFSEHEDLQKARLQFRDWMLKYRRTEIDHAQRLERGEEYVAARRQEQLKERRRLSSLNFAVIYGHWKPGEFMMALSMAPDTESTLFTDASKALKALREFDILVGLDPRTCFELMGWDLSDKAVVDITPPFKSVPTRAGRRKAISVVDSVKMVTGRALNEPKKIEGWAAKGDTKRLRAAIESDLELSRQYWRFGVIHGSVLRGDEWMPVSWNLRMELTLITALRWCIEDQHSLHLVLRDGTRGTFFPTKLEHRYHDDDLLTGRWTDERKPVVIRLSRVMDFEYPYEVDEERLPRIFG